MSDRPPSPASTLIVGSYSSADEPGIHTFELDSTLRPLRSFSGVANPSWLTMHPDGTHLYATSEVGRADSGTNGSVHAFAIDDSTGTIDLVPLGHQSSVGDHPCHIDLHPTGRWLAVANYGTGNVSMMPILTDGALGSPTATVHHRGSGPVTARQASPHAHAGRFSPDGRWLIIADLGIDRLVVYAFDDRDGTLAPHTEIETAPGAGPRLLTFHDERIFTVNELDNTLTMYDWLEGAAAPVQTFSTLPARVTASLDENSVDENIAAGLSVSANGRHLYVTNRGHDSVAVFNYDRDDGLTFVTTQPCDGSWPRSCTVTLDGAHLVVANQHSDHVSILAVVDDGERVGPAVGRAHVPQPSAVVIRRAVEAAGTYR